LHIYPLLSAANTSTEPIFLDEVNIYMKLNRLLLIFFIAISTLKSANATLLIFDDREAFEQAVNTPLDFDGFNDSALTTIDLSSGTNFHRYRTTTSHVSEGEKALSIRERDIFTVSFDYDVFAVGFDVNELNATSLSYRDDIGNEILAALKVTDVWNASTFFGVISDRAFRSFSLVGNGDPQLNATYGFDALSYTAATKVPTPATLLIFVSGLLVLLTIRK
jgi:hypothetical protein